MGVEGEKRGKIDWKSRKVFPRKDMKINALNYSGEGLNSLKI